MVYLSIPLVFCGPAEDLLDAFQVSVQRMEAVRGQKRSETDRRYISCSPLARKEDGSHTPANDITVTESDNTHTHTLPSPREPHPPTLYVRHQLKRTQPGERHERGRGCSRGSAGRKPLETSGFLPDHRRADRKTRVLRPDQDQH